MKEKLKKLIKGKKVLILGFGREGQSSYKLIRLIAPEKFLTIADKENEHQDALLLAQIDQSITLRLGQNYLEDLNDFDIIIKSPGIKLDKTKLYSKSLLISQTQLFLRVYSKQTIGVTGTKGKSTTASLIHHVLQASGKDSLLVGNIGIPPFSAIEKINNNTIIVFELSAHQLEDLSYPPHIGVFLNIFEEHLDHFQSFNHYAKSKSKIFNQQNGESKLIFNLDQHELLQLIPKSIQTSGMGFSLSPNLKAKCYVDNGIIFQNLSHTPIRIINTAEIKNLIGTHNLYNIMAAFLACSQCGLTDTEFLNGLKHFHSLEHRLEYVGIFKGIHFYNDSISTIPEATIAALNSLPETDTLILGGFDRGINYNHFIDSLINFKVQNLIFMGPAGKRMQAILKEKYPSEKNILEAKTLDEALAKVFNVTLAGKICLLSPAASSYDAFKNFEDRGNAYKKRARSSS